MPPPLPDRVDRVDEGPVMIIRLVHEGRANALTESMLSQLAKHYAPDICGGVRCAILTGDGDKHFSSGAELGTDEGEKWAERIKRIEQGIANAASAIQKAAFPTIAALNGDAVGGGLELAMACDWRVAREDARLAMPPARLGLVYTAEGLRRFATELGMARTREIFLTGRAFDARHALEIGLVSHLAPAAEVLPVAQRMAAAVAANSPLAVEGMRNVLRAILDDDGADGKAQQYRVRAFGSKDLLEGVAAARERRNPNFSGS